MNIYVHNKLLFTRALYQSSDYQLNLVQDLIPFMIFVSFIVDFKLKSIENDIFIMR